MGNVTREEEEEEVGKEHETKTVQHTWPCEAVAIREVTNGAVFNGRPRLAL